MTINLFIIEIDMLGGPHTGTRRRKRQEWGVGAKINDADAIFMFSRRLLLD